MDIVTIRIGKVGAGFISGAQSIAETLLSFGYEVQSVVIDREGQSPVAWKPMFTIGQRVKWMGEEGGMIGTITDMRLSAVGESMRYRVQWDGENPLQASYWDDAEIVAAEVK
jgi:hypothetical protein